MVRIRCFAAALVFMACGGHVRVHAAKTAKTAPTKDALVALEKSAYEAWKSKDATFWDTFLSDKFVGYGSSGRLDKAAAIQEHTSANCEIKSYTLSDEEIRPIGKNAALITYKATVDGTCGGQKVPVNSWEASVYVREGDGWKAVFHAEDAVVDLKAATVQPAEGKEAPKQFEAKPDAADANTEAMLAVERPFWEAWRLHDGKKLDALMTKDISFINIFGTYFPTKADGLKDWTGTGCDVARVSVTGAASTMLSPTAGILTFTGTAVGSCYGQKVDSVIWGTSIYVKEDGVWKWTFGINVPART